MMMNVCVRQYIILQGAPPLLSCCLFLFASNDSTPIRRQLFRRETSIIMEYEEDDEVTVLSAREFDCGRPEQHISPQGQSNRFFNHPAAATAATTRDAAAAAQRGGVALRVVIVGSYKIPSDFVACATLSSNILKRSVPK